MKKILSLFLVLAASFILVGCNKNKALDTENYTYTVASPGMPNKFNVHTWETNTDSLIIGYTELGLYDFVLNPSKDGYDIVNEMAAATPVDVTETYAANEKFGVPAGEKSGYAFKIALNPNAKWANGTVINADTYIYSMQQLLNPEMKNFRASSYTSGTMIIANAEGYLKQGQDSYINLSGYMTNNNITSLSEAINKATGDNLKTFINYKLSYGAMPDGSEAEDKVVDSGKTLAALYESYKGIVLNTNPGGWATQEEVDEWVLDELFVEYTYPNVSWENVGLLKTGEFEITLVLQKPITDFYLKYNLTSNWIVYKDLYEANKKSLDGGSVQTTYATSVDTYMGYGPYKLIEYQDDVQITMVKNDQWYGYTDGKHEGQFKTTRIVVPIINSHNTELMSFLQGNLDEVSLVQQDVAAYRFSENLQTVPEHYSSKLTFNTSLSSLTTREASAGTNVDKEILGNPKFREAISYSLNRSSFVQTQTAGSQATLGLMNSLYISNVDTGEVYNTTTSYKNMMKRIYGTEDPTGFDVAKAKALFTEAYNEQLAAGKISATDKVKLEFSVYLMEPAYTDKVQFIQNSINEATKGTPLEGKVELSSKLDADYYESAKKGEFDIIWATWGGMTMDPFGFMEVYTANGTHNEYGFNPESERFSMTINDETVEMTYYDWFLALNNGEYSALKADYNTRINILAEMEYNIIKQYRTVPVYSRTTLVLNSDKIKYPTTKYVPLVSFGGIRFMDYNFNDAAWADYINSGSIDYTD